jgi:hypothetical protein
MLEGLSLCKEVVEKEDVEEGDAGLEGVGPGEGEAAGLPLPGAVKLPRGVEVVRSELEEALEADVL